MPVNKTQVAVLVAALFSASAAMATTTVNYQDKTETVTSEIKDTNPSSIYSLKLNIKKSNLTFQEKVWPGSDGFTASALATIESSQVVFEKGLYLSGSDANKPSLNLKGESSVTIRGGASFKASGSQSHAVMVEGGSTLTFQDAKDIKFSTAGNPSSGMVIDASSVKFVNSTTSSFSSNSLDGIVLKNQSNLHLSGSSELSTNNRSVKVEKDSQILATDQSTLSTWYVQGAGDVVVDSGSNLSFKGAALDTSTKYEVFSGNLTAKNGATVNQTGESTALNMYGGALTIENSTYTGKAINANQGTQVNVTGDSSMTAETVNLNEADLNFSGDVNQKITITNLTGSKGKISLNGAEGTVEISNSSVTNLSLQASGAVNDASNGDPNVAKVMFGIKSGNTGNSLTMDKGRVVGKVTATYDDQGNLISKTEEVQEDNQTLSTLSALPFVIWRNELNDLHKRLGDVRTSSKDSGAWVRYNGGKSEWDKGGLDNQFNMIQVGIDTKVADQSNVRFGVAFSYTNNDTDFTGGNADADTYSLAAYGTWQGEAGLYVDVVGRLAKMENDIESTAYNGKTDNVALSLSAEGGWHFKLPYQTFFEPQIEATYSYVDSDSFTDNAVRYEIESTDSFVGRVGFRTGLQCPNNRGNVYVRGSVVHDFLGESRLNVMGSGAVRSYEADFGDTWFEYGIGANINITDASYMYLDVERLARATLEEPWRVNVGFRYAW